MARKFAIINGEGQIVFQTKEFESADVTERLALSDGTTLLLSDDATVQSLRAELAEAKNANAAKEEFLSNMSHDIRTPMNAIIGMTALAKKHIDEKARVMDALNKIDVASSHLLGLINDILDISRINSGGFVIGVIKPPVEPSKQFCHCKVRFCMSDINRRIDQPGRTCPIDHIVSGPEISVQQRRMRRFA